MSAVLTAGKAAVRRKKSGFCHIDVTGAEAVHNIDGHRHVQGPDAPDVGLDQKRNLHLNGTGALRPCTDESAGEVREADVGDCAVVDGTTVCTIVTTQHGLQAPRTVRSLISEKQFLCMRLRKAV